MKVMKEQCVFLNLSSSLEKIDAGLRFQDDDFIMDEEDRIDSHFLARNRKLQKQSPVSGGLVVLQAFPQALS